MKILVVLPGFFIAAIRSVINLYQLDIKTAPKGIFKKLVATN